MQKYRIVGFLLKGIVIWNTFIITMNVVGLGHYAPFLLIKKCSFIILFPHPLEADCT
jgi:hypothetical protein